MVALKTLMIMQAVFYLLDQLYLEKSTDLPWQQRFSTNVVWIQLLPVYQPPNVILRNSWGKHQHASSGPRCGLNRKEDASLSGMATLSSRSGRLAGVLETGRR